MVRRPALLVAIFLLVLTSFSVLPVLLSGKAIGPFDQLGQMAPYNGPKASQPWDVLQADGVLQFSVWRTLVLEGWASGVPPTWNPYQLAGTPLLATSQPGALYPLHILMGLLHVPPFLAMSLLAWFHLFWAGLGVFFLVRRLGGTHLGGAVAGAAFSTSTFLFAWLALPSVGTTVAWIPWALAALVALLTEGTRPGTLLTLAASVAMLFLAGHLQFAAYGMMALGVVGVGMLLVRSEVPKGRATAGAVLAVAVGVLWAWPQLGPVLDYGQYSHRRGAPTAEGYAAYAGSALQPTDLVSRLANPFGQGLPVAKAAEGVEFSSYWPALSRPGANFAESALTLGAPVVVLLFLLPFAGLDWRRWGPIAAVAILALALAFGTPLNRLLYFGVPGWSATGSPGRVIVLFVLAGCVLAGGAFRPDRWDVKDRLWQAFAGLGLFTLLVSLRPFRDAVPQGMPHATWDAIVASATPAALLGGALGAVSAGLLLAAAIKQRYHAILLPCAMAFLAVGGSTLVRSGDPSVLRPELPSVGTERVAILNEPWSLVGNPPATMPPNLSALVRVAELGGYDSLLHRDTVALLREVNGRDPAPPANGNIMFIKPGADAKALAEAGVTQVWASSPEALTAYGAPEPIRDRLFRVRLEGPGLASLSNGVVSNLAYRPNGFGLEVSGSGTLTLRFRNLPGWRATIDGRSVPIREGRWIVLELPEGARRVELTYGAISPILWLWLLGPIAFAFSLRKPRPTPSAASDREAEPAEAVNSFS